MFWKAFAPSLRKHEENTYSIQLLWLLSPNIVGRIMGNWRFVARGKGGLEEWWDPQREKIYDFSYCGASTGECTAGSVCLGLCLWGTPTLLGSVCTPGTYSLCLSRAAFSLSLDLGDCVVRDEPAGATPTCTGTDPFSHACLLSGAMCHAPS